MSLFTRSFINRILFISLFLNFLFLSSYKVNLFDYYKLTENHSVSSLRILDKNKTSLDANIAWFKSNYKNINDFSAASSKLKEIKIAGKILLDKISTEESPINKEQIQSFLKFIIT